LDFDQDFPNIDGLRQGLQQYYDIEQMTDLWSLNSGRVQVKMGVNKKDMPAKTPVSFVLIDDYHLTEHGVRYFCDNLHIIYQSELELHALLKQLREKFGCERITVQTGGTLNGLFLHEKLFAYVDIVVAPVLVGGRDTSTLIDGGSLTTAGELSQLGVLKLEDIQQLEGSYIRLRYKVIA